jgi:hypothetical protein
LKKILLILMLSLFTGISSITIFDSVDSSIEDYVVSDDGKEVFFLTSKGELKKSSLGVDGRIITYDGNFKLLKRGRDGVYVVKYNPQRPDSDNKLKKIKFRGSLSTSSSCSSVLTSPRSG